MQDKIRRKAMRSVLGDRTAVFDDGERKLSITKDGISVEGKKPFYSFFFWGGSYSSHALLQLQYALFSDFLGIFRGKISVFRI